MARDPGRTLTQTTSVSIFPALPSSLHPIVSYKSSRLGDHKTMYDTLNVCISQVSMSRAKRVGRTIPSSSIEARFGETQIAIARRQCHVCHGLDCLMDVEECPQCRPHGPSGTDSQMATMENPRLKTPLSRLMFSITVMFLPWDAFLESIPMP
jgi:hypothetical protein